MFKQLRNDFLWLNMSIISVVMLIAFGSVYASYHANLQSGNRTILDEIVDRPNERWVTSDNYVDIIELLPSEYSTSFAMILNQNGQVMQIQSFLDISKEDYYTLAEKVVAKPADYNIVRNGTNEWMYRLTSVNSVIQNGADGPMEMRGDFLKITFLEVSRTTIALNILMVNFIVATLLMLAVIYVISLYFAEKSVKPIADAWNKQKQFIADASHELKTPLAIINANIDALKANRNEKISKQEKWLNYIQNESFRMSKLVSDLLYLANTENLEIKPESRPFNLSEATKEAILSIEAIVYEKNIKLNTDIKEGLLWSGDQSKLKQVMIILIDNAIKYTNPSGKINICLKKNYRYIEFSVENTGEGISGEDLSKVFDRFYRINQARTGSDNSYGLGLSIAKATIQKMGGKITVQSIPNKATVFTISLRTKPEYRFIKAKEQISVQKPIK